MLDAKATGTGVGCAIYSTKFKHALAADLLSIRSEIILSTFILSLDPANTSHPITQIFLMISALIDEKKIKCQVILNHSPRQNRYSRRNEAVLKWLISNGIEVRFNIEKRIQHSKLIIIDSEIIYIGSHNLTRTAFSNPYELTCRLKNKEMAGQMKKNYQEYWNTLTIKPTQDGLTWRL